jgi:hypothetical protein
MIFGRLFSLKKERSIDKVIWEPNNLDESHVSLKISLFSSDLWSSFRNKGAILNFPEKYIKFCAFLWWNRQPPFEEVN